MPAVSVIIPCYNQGQYLVESIGSVLASDFDDLEIIVVDDGSSAPETCRILECLDYPKTTLIRRENGGLSTARNTGIAAAQGRYILPLDADDRIGPNYIGQSVAALDADPKLGIVYCLGEKFGDAAGAIQAASFSLPRMRFSNLIFCSALFRKEDWAKVGGYKPEMRYGCEDWEFWISLLELGRTVLRLPNTGFWYRIRHESMNALMDRQKRQAMHRLIVTLHPSLFPWWFPLMLPVYYCVINSALYRILKRWGFQGKILS
jgi:glycosyltransferase involved in cell wall biosynthesis